MKPLNLGRWRIPLPPWKRPAQESNVIPLRPPRLASAWTPRRLARTLRMPGILGTGLLVMCAAFYFSTLQPTERRLREAQQSTLSLREQIKRAGPGLKDQRPPAEQLSQFYRIFPNEKSLPDVLAKIFAAAQAQGVVLEQGEYKVTRDKDDPLMRYDITLPVQGEYPQIRKFLAGLAEDVPNAGLEQVQFERQKVGTSTIESKIKLVLYLEQQT